MAIPTPDQIAEAKRRYDLGISLDRIALELGLSRSTLRRRLLERGLVFRQDHLLPKLNPTEAAQAVRLYTSGKALSEVGALLGTTAETVRKTIRIAGLTCRPAWHIKYSLRADSFSEIRTQGQAYWLGFLAADGCVFRYPGSEQRLLSILLSQRDREHLEAFRDWLGSSHPIRDGQNAGFGKNSRSSQLQIHSKQLCLDLERHGILPRKSLLLEWPRLAPHLVPHYLRGYFDGDGCFSIYSARKTLIFSVISNEAFLAGLQDHLATHLGYRKTKFRRARCKAPVYSLCCGGTQLSLRFARHIYADASIYLPRKRQVVRGFLAMRPDCAEAFPDLL